MEIRHRAIYLPAMSGSCATIYLLYMSRMRYIIRICLNFCFVDNAISVFNTEISMSHSAISTFYAVIYFFYTAISLHISHIFRKMPELPPHTPDYLSSPHRCLPRLPLLMPFITASDEISLDKPGRWYWLH